MQPRTLKFYQLLVQQQVHLLLDEIVIQKFAHQSAGHQVLLYFSPFVHVRSNMVSILEDFSLNIIDYQLYTSCSITIQS